MSKVDLSRINDRRYLKSLTNKELANQVLGHILVVGTTTGKIAPIDIAEFRTEAWTLKTFGVQYALLSDQRVVVSSGNRYYKDEIYCFGEKLFIVNYWKEKNREYLIDWILDWVARNGLPVIHPAKPPLFENPILPKKNKGPEQSPINPHANGNDDNCNYVYYAKNVKKGERVEGLCQALQLEYLEYVTNFARDIFRNIFNEDFDIPRVELCKECPSEVWMHDDCYVTKKINDLIVNGVPVNEREVVCILRHCLRIGGEFIYNPQPLIKIYFNQFDGNDWNEYFAKISQTLAHEYMHYLEYKYCKIFGKKSYRDANVSEALADFFGVIFSLKRATDRFVMTAKDRIAVAENKYNSWVKWDGSGCPYAYALYLCIMYCVDVFLHPVNMVYTHQFLC